MAKVALKTEQDAETWQTSFRKLELRDYGAGPLIGHVVEGEARVRLITRSGFEKKHIFTSQIAAG